MGRQADGPQGQPGCVARTFVWGVLSRGEGKSTWQGARESRVGWRVDSGVLDCVRECSIDLKAEKVGERGGGWTSRIQHSFAGRTCLWEL